MSKNFYSSKKDKYQELANKFADLIEKNEAPWQKTWSGEDLMPHNLKTKKEYHGMNLLNLLEVSDRNGYGDSRWLTFLQVQELGGRVKAGAKSVPIKFLQTTDTVTELDKDGNEIKTIVDLEQPRAIWSNVFNAEQCTGLPEVEIELKNKDFNPIEKAQEILDKSGANIVHKKQSRAFYNPNNDTIFLPLKEQFTTEEEYYRTALHELGHWTGHETRLNRDKDKTGKFGNESYAKEELVAEITSFLVGTQCGLGHEPHQNNIAYIKEWSKSIRENSNYLYNAVKEANQAAELILGKELTLEMDNSIEDEIEQNKEQGFFKDLVINFAWSEEDFGIEEDTILRSEEAYKFLDKLVKLDTEQNKIQERMNNGEEIDGAYYYKTKFELNYKDYTTGSTRIDIGDYEFGGKEKVSEALEHISKMYPNYLIRNEDLANFKKEENRYLEYLQQKNFKENKFIDKNHSVIYIKVPLEEKDEAKSLGAKWDKNLVSWFIPKDKDVELFNKWEKVEEKELIEKQARKNKEKYILAVPYMARYEVKALGAEWDKDNKVWYCMESEKEKFSKWDIKNTKNKVKVDMSLPASEEFLLKIKEMGVTENNIIADGEKHRISVDGDKGKEQSGFYVFHADGVANGYFMNNRTGEEIKWVSKSSEIISAEKKAELQAMAVQKRQERQNEENIAREKAENKLQDIYSQSTPAKDNSYLDKKNILASNDLKTTKYNDLMVPLYDIDRQLKSAQYIKSDGSKIFAKDCNSQGNFHIINKEFDKLNNCNTVVISEGYATANTVHEALRSNKESDIPVIASMSAKNIEKVIEAINNKYQEEGYPLKNIIICADNDKSKNQNVGLDTAKKVSEKYKNVSYIIPKREGKEFDGDFNDLVSKDKSYPKEKALKEIANNVKSKVKEVRQLIVKDPTKERTMISKQGSIILTETHTTIKY